jgi:tetratricopeptide (TPR) repeat protein
MILPVLIFTLIFAQASVQTAQTQFDAGNYRGAIATLSASLPQSRDSAQVHYWLGRNYYELHEYDKAASHLEQATKLDPKNAEYFRQLGHVYGALAEERKSFTLARKVKQALETSVTLAPGSISARRDFMQYLAEAPWVVGGDKAKARSQIKAIAAIDPIQGKMAQAAYYASVKDWKEAEEEYNSIIASRPANIEAYMEAAGFFEGRGNAGGIEKSMEGAARVNSRDPRIGYFKGVALVLRRTDQATAERLLKSYIALPERSDYPSRKSATEWLKKIGK